MVFVFSSCSLCLPDLFTYPIFRGARAIVVLQSYVGLQSPWEPHRRRCFLSRNVGKNMPLATFGPECYSSHPFLWNFRSFLTCISRWAVASRIEKVEVSTPYWQHARIFSNSRFRFRWGDFIPQKRWWSVLCFVPMQTVIGQKLVWNGLLKKARHEIQEDDVIPILLYTSWHSRKQKTVRVCKYMIFTLSENNEFAPENRPSSPQKADFIFTTIHFQRQTLHQIPCRVSPVASTPPSSTACLAAESLKREGNKKGKKRSNNLKGTTEKQTHLSTLSEVSSTKVKLLHLRVVWLFFWWLFFEMFWACNCGKISDNSNFTQSTQLLRSTFVILGTFFWGDGFAGCCVPILPKCFYICQNPEWEVTPPGFPQIVQNWNQSPLFQFEDPFCFRTPVSLLEKSVFALRFPTGSLVWKTSLDSTMDSPRRKPSYFPWGILVV